MKYLNKADKKEIKQKIAEGMTDFCIKYKDKIPTSLDYYEDFYAHIYFDNENTYLVDDTDASNYLVYVNKRPTWF